jgi:hypothetical protein
MRERFQFFRKKEVEILGIVVSLKLMKTYEHAYFKVAYIYNGRITLKYRSVKVSHINVGHPHKLP